MRKTEQYDLNQWELSDRIRMEDFNADNAKIAAALAGKMGKMEVNRFKQFDWITSAINASFILDDWDEWSCFFALINPNVLNPGSGDYISICLEGDGFKTTHIQVPPKPALYILFPMYDGSQKVQGILLAENTVHVFTESISYPQLLYVSANYFPLTPHKMDHPSVWFFGLK